LNTSARNLSTILVVDDEVNIRKILEMRLISRGYRVCLAKNGLEALARTKSEKPDLIILDIRMPGMDGFQVCQEIRRESRTPIIMLSALSDVKDRVRGLELGADDYMVKPFAPKELLTRVAAILRRQPQARSISRDTGVLTFDTLAIDTNRRNVFIRGKSIQLTEIEFSLLEQMANQPGITVTREEFIKKVWGYVPEQGHDMRVIDVHISRIRDILHKNLDQKQYIFTVRGKGYRFLDASEIDPV
jgi:two-component system, OmpR family, response regulator RpaB